jgi:imidazolonepropionase-like amidohydrolase
VREMGAPAGMMPALKDAVNLNLVLGPTIVNCDTHLTITGGYGRKENVLGKEVDSPDEMRKAVRGVFKRGGDFIKLITSGKVYGQGSAPESVQFSQEEINAAVEEAHRVGRKVTVHAIGRKAIESSIRAGVDSIEHGNFLTRDLARTMAEKGIFLVPTLLPYHTGSHPPPELILAPEVRRNAEAVWKATLSAFAIAREERIKMGAGTDSGGPGMAHTSLGKELSLMTAMGLSPMEAIQSATRINAEILDLPDIGSLEKGKRADVIAVEGNPLDDIQALSKIKLVLKNGREISKNPPLFG